MKKLEDIIYVDDDLRDSRLNELTGSIYMDTHVSNGNYISDEGRFFFYCGPEIEEHALSDSVNIYDYLEELCDNLNIDICVCESENFHSIKADSLEGGKQKYELIKKAIQNDGINVFDDSPDSI